MCPENVRKQRRCQELDYNVFSKPKSLDEISYQYSFCPAMATWDEEAIELFNDCLFAMNSGILPTGGHFKDQPEKFVDVYPVFLQHWKARNYNKIWSDVAEFSKIILESIFGKKK